MLGPNAHLRLDILYIYTFYPHYNMDWKANMKIGLGTNNSVIKRFWCIHDVRTVVLLSCLVKGMVSSRCDLVCKLSILICKEVNPIFWPCELTDNLGSYRL